MKKIIMALSLLFSTYSFSFATMNLPGASAVYEVGPGGQAVTNMMGWQKLRRQQLENQMLRQEYEIRQQELMQQRQMTERNYQQEQGSNAIDYMMQKISNCLSNKPVHKSCYGKVPFMDKSYVITPTKNLTYHGNKHCREFTFTLKSSREQYTAKNLACLSPDGEWGK